MSVTEPSIAEIVRQAEMAGVTFRLDGQEIKVRYPERSREDLAPLLVALRQHKTAVAEFLQVRSARPASDSTPQYPAQPCTEHLQIAPKKPTRARISTQAIPCWHCQDTGECDCISCGVMKPGLLWVAGECVACKARKVPIQ